MLMDRTRKRGSPRQGTPILRIKGLQPKQKRWMVEYGNFLLEGVGKPYSPGAISHVAEGAYAIHIRRALSDTELELLTAEWLALPAIDDAGLVDL